MKIGFFGKLPSYGDFIKRNVSPAVIDYWDNWILQAFDNSRSELKEQWKGHFFTSPIWRFTIDSRIVSNETISGLMMPSVDSIGRCYPFFVFCRFSANTDTIKLASMIDDCHEKCEEFLLNLLDTERPDLEMILSQISQFYEPIKRQHIPKIQKTASLRHEIYEHNGINEKAFCEVNESFLSALVEQHYAPMTVWHRASSQTLPSQYRYFKGMPPIHSFSSFLGN